jgi:hypothetical protein
MQLSTRLQDEKATAAKNRQSTLHRDIFSLPILQAASLKWHGPIWEAKQRFFSCPAPFALSAFASMRATQRVASNDR